MQNELRSIFDEASALKSNHIREQLAYRHMIALADTFDGWALDKRLTPQQTAKVLGWAEQMRQLADLVGTNWDPPPPKELTIFGFLGRLACGE